MEAYARVIPDQNLDRSLDYEIPEPFRGGVQVGTRVRVPIRQRLVLGTVVALLEETSVKGLKPIAEVIDEKPTISPKLLQLSRWIADYYCCPVEMAIRCVLPQVIRNAEMGHQRRKWLRLAPDVKDEVVAALEKKAPRQAEVLALLKENAEGLYLAQVIKQTGVSAAVIKGLEKRGLLIEGEAIKERDPFVGQNFIQSTPPVLEDEQRAALDRVLGAMDNPTGSKPLLLHGITGSGKTEIYLHAIKHAIQTGRTALVLVPEISLTPQTVDRFKSRFADIQRQIAVLHSHLSDGERHDEWHRIRSGEAKIVIGARSAVFAPLENLGLIVVDEEHESSYKQEEVPRYHARDVAVVRAKSEGCAILLGSATPSFESYRNAVTGKYERLSLSQRIDSRQLPVIRILDMRQMNAKKGDNIISFPLCTAIEARLTRREQSILFLNRRGFSSSMVCTKCGFVAECPNCSVALTYHRSEARLTCHICGHNAVSPSVCPSCKDPAIRYQGVGTQRVEESVRRVFPHARVVRMDADTMNRKHAYSEVLGSFRKGEIDILIGTQMIAKGLDFPNVTLVGIINADISLHLPDFRAGERTFQLITQVAGRAGRGDVLGEVFVQTFTPMSPSIQFGRHHDFIGFYEQDIEFREQFKYPPVTHMTLITVRSTSREKAEFSAETLKRRLEEVIPKDSAIIGGPAPAPLEKAKTFYRYHITIRGSGVSRLGRSIRDILQGLSFPDDVTATVDVDPQQLL
ncbi:MAG: primosomal protein N' [Chthoniobacterales bacterium]